MKHAVVTGAGSGIGAAIARSLSEQNYKVSMLGRRLEALHETAQLSGVSNEQCFSCDVTDQASTQSACCQVSMGWLNKNSNI